MNSPPTRLPTLKASVPSRRNPASCPSWRSAEAASRGEHVGDAMKLLADDVRSVVIPGTGHWVAETAPEEMPATLTTFLAASRKASARRNAVAVDSRVLR